MVPERESRSKGMAARGRGRASAGRIRHAFLSVLARILSVPAWISLLALSQALATFVRGIFSPLSCLPALPRGGRLGAAALAALLVTASTAIPYAHAPRDMPMIVGHDACACTCTAPPLQALFSQLACYWQDGGADPFGRVLAAKGLGDTTAMTEFLLSSYSEQYLRRLIEAHAGAI